MSRLSGEQHLGDVLQKPSHIPPRRRKIPQGSTGLPDRLHAPRLPGLALAPHASTRHFTKSRRRCPAAERGSPSLRRRLGLTALLKPATPRNRQASAEMSTGCTPGTEATTPPLAPIPAAAPLVFQAQPLRPVPLPCRTLAAFSAAAEPTGRPSIRVLPSAAARRAARSSSVRKLRWVATSGTAPGTAALPRTYLLVEGPPQERVVGSFHHHEEEGQVGPTPGAVPVQVHAQTHLVAVLARVESYRRVAEQTQ